MRAVIYARVSGDDRGSLAGQLDMGRAYAVDHGYTVMAELSEDWVSGAAMDAPELQRALDMAMTGSFDVLIVREMDRLARDLVKQMMVEEQLHKAGVAIEYVLGEYPNTPEGTLNKQIRAVVAEYERQKITERSIRGRRASSKAGHVLGGRAPYGYRFTEDHLHIEVVESEANVIRMIYTWYTSGNGNGEPLSSLRIAEKLSALQIPTWADLHGTLHKTNPFGSWDPKRILAVIHNETYAGTFYYGRANHGATNPAENWIPVDVPAIIDDNTWSAAQWQCHRNMTRPAKPVTHDYLLQGHITCGECGGAVYAVSDTHNPDRVYRYYRCGDKIKGRDTCPLPGFRVEPIDTMAWEWIMGLLLDPERITAGFEALQHNPLWDNPTQRRYNEAQERQVILTAQRDRLLDLYLTGHIEKAVYLDRATVIDGELQSAIREQRAIENACERDEPPTEGDLTDALTFAEAIAEELQTADFATKRRIIVALDARANLYEDRRADIEIGIPKGGMRNKYINAPSYIHRIHLRTTLHTQ